MIRMVLGLIFAIGTLTLSAQQPIIYLGAAPGATPNCNCLNNATTVGNGQFAETITVEGPAGANWTVAAVLGFFSSASPAPPAAPLPVTVGTPLVEVSPGRYQLSGRHVTGQGFSIQVTNGTVNLQVGNTCYYPNVQITGLPDTVCLSGLPVVLTANNNGAQGTGSFTIDGTPATVFNAQALGVGTYVVAYTFDAGVGTPGNAGDPGCSITVQRTVVVPPQPNTAVIAQINVNLGPDCQALITPRMVMPGGYPCYDDFIVTVFNLQGQPIGNLVTGQYAGQTLTVQVMSVAGQFVGSGQINVFDINPPTISCPTQVNQAIIPNQVQLFGGSLTVAQPTFIPSNFSCYATAVAPVSGLHYYQLRTITVSATDVYTFELLGDFAGGGAFGIYQTTFNPFGGPCQNIAAVSENSTPGLGYFTTQPNIRTLTVMLMAGMSYTLLTTSFDGNRTGNYQYAVYSESTGLINGVTALNATVTLPLYCNSAQFLANNPTSLQWTGSPTVLDACMLNPTVTFTDVVNNGAFCGPASITRTFTVRDQANNTASCTQQIVLPPIDIDDVVMPPRTMIIHCDEPFASLPSGNPQPSVTGRPLVISAFGVFPALPVYCNILSTYTDLPSVQLCDGTRQFVRRWLVLDDCNASSVINYDQVVRIADMRAPTVTCTAPDLNQDGLPDTLQYSTTSNLCAAAFNAPIPEVIDDCSEFSILTELVTVRITPITNPFGVITGYDTSQVVLASIPAAATNRLLNNVPVGRHWLRYTVTDDCGNVAVQDCPIRVNDLSPPTAVCDDDLNVSLGGNGIGVIMAQDIDEGSSDNCGPVTLEVRRMLGFNPTNCTPLTPAFTPWGPSVNVYCCDIGQQVMIQLRVTDQSGNTNTCTTNLRVLDNTAPICVAPNPAFRNCSQLPANFNPDSIPQLQALFGVAQLIDDCSTPTLVELAPIVNLSDCGNGTILRRFQGTDVAGNSSTGVCQQLVTITGRTDYDIKFPRDVRGDCAAVVADTLAVFNRGCDNLAISVSDEVFDVDADVCYKIFRTYTVINWCEYDGFSAPIEISRDPDCNGTAGEADVWVSRRENATYLDADNNHTNGLPVAGARGTSCNGQSNPAGYWQTTASVGYWRYVQHIKVIDTAGPNITFTPPQAFCAFDNETCAGTVNIGFSVNDDCTASPPTLTVEIDLLRNGVYDGVVTNLVLQGSYPNYNLNGVYPIGQHAFRVRALDNCGNTQAVVIPFEVADCTVPSAVCASGVIVPLMIQPPNTDADGDGDVDPAAAVVNVGLFITSSIPDCTGPLKFTVHKTADVLSGADIPAPNHPALVVTCDEIGTLPVRVYTWDAAFNPTSVQPDGTVGGPNYSYCDALLVVQDNGGFCANNATMGQVAGVIATEAGNPVAGVEVYPAVDQPDMALTGNDGYYHFDLATGESYLVAPRCDTDWGNGVTTLDIVITAKHILGVQLITSPYRIIAADVNRSNTVTTLDLVHMRRLILGLSDTFPNNNSWRFIWSAFDFPDPTNPWLEPFPEAISIPNLQQNFMQGNFVGIKVGDVNGTATANQFDGVEERSVGATYYLRVQEQEFAAGDELEVVWSAADAEAFLAGCQFTLQFDPAALELLDIDWARFQEEHTNQEMLEDGIMPISWHATTAHEATGNEAFLVMRLRAHRAGRLSEALGITSRVTRAEAYGEDEEIYQLGLNFATVAATADNFVLEQNRPNPFGDQTVIGFQLPDAGHATLTIYDTNGRVVLQQRRYYEAGYNQIMVDAADITARGLLYYKLETDRYAATRKMVILETR